MPPLEINDAPTQADHDALIAPLLTAKHGCTVAVMVASIDGRATSEGRVGPLTAAADQWLLLGLREQAQALLIGAATLRAEGYGGLLDDEAKDRRRASGLPSEPHLYVLARDLQRLQGTEATRPAGPLLTVLHPPEAEPSTAGGMPGHVHTRAIPFLPDGRPDLPAALNAIRAAHPDGLIVSEGGPTLLGMLVEQHALEQLIVAVSPRIQGGAEKRLLELASRVGRPVRLQAAAAAGGFAFLRYALDAS